MASREAADQGEEDGAGWSGLAPTNAERKAYAAELLRRKEIEQLRTIAKELAEALELYADESFYHGVTILVDKPTGGFDDDISLDEDSDYDYPKPGKAARAALAKYNALVNHD